MRQILDPSPEALLCQALVGALGRDGAHKAIDALVSRFSNVELAAFAAHSPFWLRPKQKAPPSSWRSWGLLQARGTGKTKCVAMHINDEVWAGRAMRIGLAAQNETKTISVQVGTLIETAPPWCRPEWIASSLRLVWPNGAVALAFTPEVPGAIRSENLHIAWLSELQSWPIATREEAYSNFLFATRVGYARTIWDATPKRAHPILKRLLARAEAEPDRHVVVRGTIYENPHLASGVVADMEREYGGTQKGREELLGEMLEESDAALFKQAWIEVSRRQMPDRLVRRAIGIDPAVTTRGGSDKTGIVEAGLGVDGHAYILGDYSGKHAATAWADIVLDRYVRGGCDLIIAEMNKGHDLVTQNLRARAGSKGLSVVLVGKDERAPAPVAGTVYVKEVFARGAKDDRAQPIATAYERGRVSHVLKADLSELEDTMTTWEPGAPGQRSPDALDALVHVVKDLLGLSDNAPDLSVGFRGIEAVSRALATPSTARNIATILGGGSGGRI